MAAGTYISITTKGVAFKESTGQNDQYSRQSNVAKKTAKDSQIEKELARKKIQIIGDGEFCEDPLSEDDLDKDDALETEEKQYEMTLHCKYGENTVF